MEAVSAAVVHPVYERVGELVHFDGQFYSSVGGRILRKLLCDLAKLLGFVLGVEPLDELPVGGDHLVDIVGGLEEADGIEELLSRLLVVFILPLLYIRQFSRQLVDCLQVEFTVSLRVDFVDLSLVEEELALGDFSKDFYLFGAIGRKHGEVSLPLGELVELLLRPLLELFVVSQHPEVAFNLGVVLLCPVGRHLEVLHEGDVPASVKHIRIAQPDLLVILVSEGLDEVEDDLSGVDVVEDEVVGGFVLVLVSLEYDLEDDCLLQQSIDDVDELFDLLSVPLHLCLLPRLVEPDLPYLDQNVQDSPAALSHIVSRPLLPPPQHKVFVLHQFQDHAAYL